MPENENKPVDLEWMVHRHEAEFDRFSKRIAELEDAIRIIVRFAPGMIVEQARLEANKATPSQWSGSQPPDLAFRESCRKLVEKYGRVNNRPDVC
jgi:hypothetical protein